MKETFIGIIAIGILAVIGFVIFGSKGTNTNPTPNTQEGEKVELNVTSADWSVGSLASLVTVVEYADFQCPACKAYEPMVAEAKKEFGSSVLFVFRHFPLIQIHSNALSAAKAAEAAGAQGKFFEMHDLLFKNQEVWSKVANPVSMFEGYAKEIGLSDSVFKADFSSEQTEETISNSYKKGVQFGVNGTPTFFINGVKIQNPRNYAEFKALIETALKQ